MKVLTVIPARYGSTRFPGKPLTPILGKPMILWVIEGAMKSKNSHIIVATDDERICDAVSPLVECKMTPSELPSGTDRVAYVAKDLDFDIVVNLQGDEPLIDGKIIDDLVEALDETVDIVTPVRRVSREEAQKPGAVTVVTDKYGNALYFSRSLIPFYREKKDEVFLKHIGIYVFWKNSLLKFVTLSPGKLEMIEKLEQLRALENGMKIRVVEVSYRSIPVDYPEDVKLVEQELLKRRG